MVYVVPGPNNTESRVTQFVYPYAKPVALTYMRPGQVFWGDGDGPRRVVPRYRRAEADARQRGTAGQDADVDGHACVARRAVRWAVLAALASALVPFASDAGTAASATEIRVPEDARTLQLAIARARPGDTILLAAGTYPGGNVVPASKHDITIRGADRNRVVLDGDDRRKDGILVRPTASRS